MSTKVNVEHFKDIVLKMRILARVIYSITSILIVWLFSYIKLCCDLVTFVINLITLIVQSLKIKNGDT